MTLQEFEQIVIAMVNEALAGRRVTREEIAALAERAWRSKAKAEESN